MDADRNLDQQLTPASSATAAAWKAWSQSVALSGAILLTIGLLLGQIVRALNQTGNSLPFDLHTYNEVGHGLFISSGSQPSLFS